MKPKIILTALFAFTLAAVVSAVVFSHHRQPPPTMITDVKTFEVHGQVRGVDAANRTVRIAHEEIPNYMPAMSMPFPVKDVAMLNGLHVGDSVQFELVVTDNDSWVAHIEKIAADTPLATSPGSASTLSPQERDSGGLQNGQPVPDFKLVDQDGRAVRLSDFRGKVVVLTFVYTRCPLPNFCPLMSRNFSQLEQRLGGEFPNQFHLLSVSMDPDFDTPKVLKEYAARYDANAKDWTFATGNATQIEFVAGLMGLYYARENGLITHDLRTALIGPDGRLVHLWKSNVWTPYEVQRRVRETLTGSRDVAAR